MKSGIKMRTKDVKNFIFREKILFLSKVLQLIDRQAEQVEHMKPSRKPEFNYFFNAVLFYFVPLYHVEEVRGDATEV